MRQCGEIPQSDYWSTLQLQNEMGKYGDSKMDLEPYTLPQNTILGTVMSFI